jgi:cell division protein FtsL
MILCATLVLCAVVWTIADERRRLLDERRRLLDERRDTPDRRRRDDDDDNVIFNT